LPKKCTQRAARREAAVYFPKNIDVSLGRHWLFFHKREITFQRCCSQAEAEPEQGLVPLPGDEQIYSYKQNFKEEFNRQCRVNEV